MTREIPLKASRTRRCRHQHTCGLCHGLVLVGQQEGLVGRVGWCHVTCVVSGQQPGGAA